MAKRQIIIRHLPKEVCESCGEVNSFKQSCGFRDRGTVKIAWARCRKCGAIAQIRGVKK